MGQHGRVWRSDADAYRALTGCEFAGAESALCSGDTFSSKWSVGLSLQLRNSLTSVLRCRDDEGEERPSPELGQCRSNSGGNCRWLANLPFVCLFAGSV